MRKEFDTRFYRVVKKLDANVLSKTDKKYLDSRIRSFVKQGAENSRKSVGKQRRRAELADLARRIVFKGAPYPDRDPATLPVWKDPDK